LIVESGIWKGQSTWLLEQACPTANLVSIDLNLANRQYISDRAIYSDRDLSEQDWSGVTDRSLVFFDDHQNAYKRLQQCKWFGFRHVIFDDNYPATQGDCYSLKKVMANVGFEATGAKRQITKSSAFSTVLHKSAKLIGAKPISQYEAVSISPNNIDSKMMRKHLDVYYEFPPLFKTKQTRWGDEWNEATYPTPEPLLDRSLTAFHNVFLDEAMHYTWVCYAQLK
jgi:hypothetical protein